MKKKIIIAAIVLAIVLSVALAFTLGAGAASAEPSVSIGGKTLVLGNSIYIRYMVAAENVDISNVSLLVWAESQDSYVKGTEKYEVKWVKGTTTNKGITYYHFDFQDVAAKRLTDNFYTVAYTKVGDTEYYSVPHKYSVLQFAYKTMGKLGGSASTTAGLVPMLESMLEYGANAQVYFSNYRIDRLANADYYQVKLVGGKLDDGFADGLYLEGDLVNITADAPADGYYFAGWKNSAGGIVSTNATATVEVGTANEVYTADYEKIPTFTVSFVDYDGAVLKTEIVEEGKGATAPAAPERDGYEFIGWDKSFDNVTENITVTAQYEKKIPTVSVGSVEMNESDKTVDVVISVLNNPGISSLMLEVTYDDCLKIQSFASAPAFGAYVTAPNKDGYKNPQKITFISPLEDVVTSGEFATLTFEIVGDITADTVANISVKATESYNFNFDSVAFEVENGTVSIKADQTAPAYTRDGDYIYFGEYPQTIKADDVTITSTQDSRGYYLGSDGSYYAMVSANPYESGYTFSTGADVTSGETYYFKVEPIRWRILSEDGESAFILCDSIIANNAFDDNSNNYAESEIRAWLNYEFYNTAFTVLQQQIILTTTVDNSAESADHSSNSNVCENTEDKIFLLSYAEITNADYGFPGSYNSSTTRRMLTSDYSRATGAYMGTSSSYLGNGYWWLRSPSYHTTFDASFVDYDGYAYYYYFVFYGNVGVVPAMWIKL